MEVNSLIGLKGPFLSHAAAATKTKVEPDFSGWATRVGIRCKDGRTIKDGAFEHQDKMQVPLVWSHGHSDPENVLGHVILEHHAGKGVYCHAFFNDTSKAEHAKKLVKHKDINSLSIWANELLERGKEVLHGAIKEVSLVLAGANPGALIDYIGFQHGDSVETSEDEAIIYTGLTFGQDLAHADDGGDGGEDDGEDDETIQDVIDTMNDKQKEVLNHCVTVALAAPKTTSTAQHSALGDDKKGDKEVKHANVFDQSQKAAADAMSGDKRPVLSHSDMEVIHTRAKQINSLKGALEEYCLQHGIENLGILFPEAKLLENGAPAFVSREMAWVGKVLGGAGKSPFSRVKSRSADITFEEARAKGYIKGHVKKEEFFAVSQRETHPQTIYKKQKLDRDDILDITDYDVVAWLKAEMRVMLNEELARAILIGDGREVGDEDKIKEDRIRPIAKDDPFFTITVNVDLNADGTSIETVHDQIILNRQYYKGSGNPTMFTTETFIGQSLLARDLQGRKIYNSLSDLQTTLRVGEIVAVEVLDQEPDIAAIIVNMSDYNIGTDRGGEVSLFDDFDIDYNQYKYLIETRCSGALVKPKSAMVIRTTGAGATPATATPPGWDAATFTVTIPVDANVDYVDANTGAALPDGPYVLDPGEVLTVRAVATAGHYLTNVKVEWSYLRPSAPAV